MEHRDALAVVEQHDGHETLLYVDPPYVHSSRSFKWRKSGQVYAHEMTDEQHQLLAARLRQVEGMVVLSRIGAQPVFRTRTGSAYTPDGLRSVWHKVKVAAGLRDVRFHDLRRKAGSDMETDAMATALLGHAHGGTTKRHYRAKLAPVRPAK